MVGTRIVSIRPQASKPLAPASSGTSLRRMISFISRARDRIGSPTRPSGCPGPSNHSQVSKRLTSSRLRSLDGIVEQFVDSGGLWVQLELGATTYCRGDQHKASHQLRSRERCIECQSTPHGTAHQPCGFVSYDFKQGKQVIDMREGCRRDGGLSEPPSVIRHWRHGLDELSDDLVPAPPIRHSGVEKHCHGTRSAATALP